MKDKKKKLILYLAISFGACWGIGGLFILFGEYLIPITGELTLMNPLVIAVLYSPSIAGLIVYFVTDGFEGVKGILKKLIPRKQDLIWFPIFFMFFLVFAATMHYGSILFGIDVPEMTYTVPQMIKEALKNLYEETGLIGGVFGWIGFVLPYFQGKFKNNVPSALLAGLLFGLWVIPGYLISSFGTITSYPTYVIQLMIFILFMSYIFNITKGNLLIYVYAFWLVATGSRLKLYYFNPQVQLLQIAFFAVSIIVLKLVMNKKGIKQELQVYPDFIRE